MKQNKLFNQIFNEVPTSKDIIRLQKEKIMKPNRETPIIKNMPLNLFKKENEIKSMKKEINFFELLSDFKKLKRK